MGDTKSAKSTEKKSFFSNVKAEFAKIIWPNRETVAKQSVAVIVITAVLATFVGLLDMGVITVIQKVLKIS